MNKCIIVLVFLVLIATYIINQERIIPGIDKVDPSRNLDLKENTKAVNLLSSFANYSYVPSLCENSYNNQPYTIYFQSDDKNNNTFFEEFNKFNQIVWQTYLCGGSPENNFDLVKDSTNPGEFYYKNIPRIAYSQSDSDYKIDAFIARFNNKNDDVWNTWFYEYYPEEIDLLDSSIYDLNLLKEIGRNFTSNEGINHQSTELIQNSDLIIFPNPFSNVLNVEFNKANSTEATIDIFDVSGKLVYFETANFISEKEIKINTEILAKGVYICLINIDDEIYNRKIIKE